MTDFDEVRLLSTKVTALTMLVEALYVELLSRDKDDGTVATAIVDSAMDAERRARERGGDEAYALHVAEALMALLDRARARAASHKGPESRD